MTDSLPVLAAAVRAAFFSLLLLGIGAVAFRWLILPRSDDDDGRALRVAARTGLFSAMLLVPVFLAFFGVQLAEFRDPFVPLSEDAALLLSLAWGRVWLFQIGLSILLIAAFGLALTGRRIGWVLAPFIAVPLAFTPAFSGHAATVEQVTWLAIGADGVHVLAAGVWLGTLFVLAVTTFRPPYLTAPLLLRRLTVFSPIALACAAAIVLTGTFGAVLHLNRVAELWTSSYGRALSLKLILFAGILALGAFNWRKATPRLRVQSEVGPMRRSVLAELAIAALLIAVTAWFVATSPPQPGA